MKHQQAVYLQEMGITHWQVRKPELFTASDPKQKDLSRCSLLVLCDERDQTHPLMSKITTAFGFTLQQVCFCSLQEFEEQQGDLPETIWSTLGEINLSHGHKILTSPSLFVLENSAAAKRALWESFCAIK